MPEFSHSIIRVAVWNLAGNNIFQPDTGIPADSEKVQNQAEGLALLDADLVTLVEVSPLGHIVELADRLANDYGVIYEHKIVEQPNSNIHIGFLHKPGIDVTDIELIENSNGSAQSGRLAVTADAKVGKFKARLIGVHLKSGRAAGEQETRDTQCAVIGDYIKTLRETPGTKTRTVLLMGDFNMIPGQDVSNFHHLGGDDLMDFVSSWDLQERFSHILSKGRANLLDGFAVSRTYSTDYIRGSLRLFPMHWTMDMGRERFREEVSDHLPFVASFRVF
ncbi:MAG: GMP synthase [Gammaproteobacteria bacterium]